MSKFQGHSSPVKSSPHLIHLVLALGFLAVLGPANLQAAPIARGYSGTQIFSTVGGDKDEGEPDHCGEPGGASSWFFYRAPRDGIMRVDTLGSSFDTVLAVYVGPGTDYASLTNVACNNDASAGQSWSQVSFEALAGTLYYIAVDGVGGANGTVKLNYQLGDALAITNQPQGLVTAVGSSATFAVEAIGLGPLNYQWLYEGMPLNGATQVSLTLPNVSPAQEGVYSVLVRDSARSLLSQGAALMICSQAPAANCVRASQLFLDNGSKQLRLIGHGGAGSVLEFSENLLDWIPLKTNSLSSDLFAEDQPLDRPQRYFRIRPAP